jgi:hypothetical protein
MTKRFLVLSLLLPLSLAALLAGCSSDDGGSVTSDGGASGSGSAAPKANCEAENGISAKRDDEVHVELNEWAVIVDKKKVKAGNIEFDVKNVGSEKHEFVVIHGAKPSDLTITDKGIDEEALPDGASAIGELGSVKAKTGHCTVTFKMPAGDYTLMCNIVDDMGHVHVKMGMITPFTVT